MTMHSNSNETMKISASIKQCIQENGREAHMISCGDEVSGMMGEDDGKEWDNKDRDGNMVEAGMLVVPRKKHPSWKKHWIL